MQPITVLLKVNNGNADLKSKGDNHTSLQRLIQVLYFYCWTTILCPLKTSCGSVALDERDTPERENADLNLYKHYLQA